MKHHSSHLLCRHLPKLDCLALILAVLSSIRNSEGVVLQTEHLLENDFRYCWEHSWSGFALDGVVGTSAAAADQESAWWLELLMLQLLPTGIECHSAK